MLKTILGIMDQSLTESKESPEGSSVLAERAKPMDPVWLNEFQILFSPELPTALHFNLFLDLVIRGFLRFVALNLESRRGSTVGWNPLLRFD